MGGTVLANQHQSKVFALVLQGFRPWRSPQPYGVWWFAGREARRVDTSRPLKAHSRLSDEPPSAERPMTQPSIIPAMSAFGISGGGRRAEEAFRLLTGADNAPRASVGDAVLEGCPIEVKNATANTLNQVRAVKYIPLVAYHQTTSTWYVVPAQHVVRLVSNRLRGQHTENPFESATISVSNLGAFRVEDESQLRDRVLEAIRSADEHPELRAAMQKVLLDSKGLAADAVTEVRNVLQRDGLL